jgi:hypothetical protein
VSRRSRFLIRSLAVGAVATGAYLTIGRARLRSWGATDDDQTRPLPGDDLIETPVYSTTRAIEIETAPSAIWPWLIQMGQGRGGFYSYDAIENLAGLNIRSANEIVPEYQHLAVGDIVRLAPHTGLVAAVVDPNRALVLRAAADLESKRPPKPSDPGFFDWSWAFILEPISLNTTRLVIRLRAEAARNMPLEVVGPMVWEPAHFLMERKMLRGIKQRAEANPNGTPAES